MPQRNYVIEGSNTAVMIDGKQTWLAGCRRRDCPRDCLRLDPRLTAATILGTDDPANCPRFIPVMSIREHTDHA